MSNTLQSIRNLERFDFDLRETVLVAIILYYPGIVAGSLEAAYSLNWGAREIWGKGGGETLALL